MFITFEGPEGAGKSSAVKLIAEKLTAAGRDVLATREPGDGDVGKRIRDILLNGGNIEPKTELMLYLADRAEHVAKAIIPALDAGKVVLCDRFTDSTLVYQGCGRGFSKTQIQEFNHFVAGDIRVDLTFLLDIDPVVGLARISHKDRLDNEPLEFHETIRGGFLDMAICEPIRWVIIDASQPLDQVVAQCWDVIRFRMNL